MFPMLEDLAPYLERFASDHRATIGQASAVQKIGIIGDTARFSFEQASIILRCRRYGARVIHDLAGEIDGSPEEQRVVEAALTAFIVKDEHLRARATEGYSSDAARKSSKLPQSDQDSDRVKSEARRLLLTLKLAREEG
jgi:hypothetical protein